MQLVEVAFRKTIEAKAVGYVVEDTTGAVDGDGHHVGHLKIASEIDGADPENIITIPAADITTVTSK